MDKKSKILYRRSLSIVPGQPIKVADSVDAGGKPVSALCRAIATTLKAYIQAGHDLLNGPYDSVREIAPPYFRVPCYIYVICCPDGVLVR